MNKCTCGKETAKDGGLHSSWCDSLKTPTDIEVSPDITPPTHWRGFPLHYNYKSRDLSPDEYFGLSIENWKEAVKANL